MNPITKPLISLTALALLSIGASAQPGENSYRHHHGYQQQGVVPQQQAPVGNTPGVTPTVTPTNYSNVYQNQGARGPWQGHGNDNNGQIYHNGGNYSRGGDYNRGNYSRGGDYNRGNYSRGGDYNRGNYDRGYNHRDHDRYRYSNRGYNNGGYYNNYPTVVDGGYSPVYDPNVVIQAGTIPPGVINPGYYNQGYYNQGYYNQAPIYNQGPGYPQPYYSNGGGFNPLDFLGGALAGGILSHIIDSAGRDRYYRR